MVRRRLVERFQDAVEDVSDRAIDTVASRVRVRTEEITNIIQRKMQGTYQLMLNKTLGVILLGAGTIFLALAAFYFLADILAFSNALSFLIVGVILFIVGIVFRNMKGGRESYGIQEKW